MSNLGVGSVDRHDGVRAMSRSNAATGRIYLWPGGSLWIGHGGGRTQWHEHHAHQLAVVPEGAFRFRIERDAAWSSFEGAFVPSHCPHQFEADDTAMAHLFVEPESRAGRALSARFGDARVAPLPPHDVQSAARRLFGTYRADASPTAMIDAATGVVAALCGAGTDPDPALDARLTRALAYMREHIREPLTLRDVASRAALSESRFRHLFAAETGCSFRAYVLWLRINVAIEAVMRGASWTDAAHEAGFADSAHLTRTHRRIFGIEPSAIRPAPAAARAAT